MIVSHFVCTDFKMACFHHLCCWVAFKIKNGNCFHFCFRSRFRFRIPAAETKGFPLVSAVSSYSRPFPRPDPHSYSLPVVDFEFLVLGKRALTERRPFELSNPNFVLGRFCFVSTMSKTQNHKDSHSKHYKNGHISNKNNCLRCTDFVGVCTVGVRCFYVLNAVAAGGFIEPGDLNCNERMRRIVQIPFEGLYIVLVHFPGAISFSEGPRGPILISSFEFLIPWDPSGSPGEPWGAIGTLGELSCTVFRFNILTFEAFERNFANWRQVFTTRTTWTSTSPALSLPPLGSAAAGWVGCRVPVVCVPVCLCVRVCARLCLCLCLCLSFFCWLVGLCLLPVCVMCVFVVVPVYAHVSVSLSVGLSASLSVSPLACCAVLLVSLPFFLLLPLYWLKKKPWLKNSIVSHPVSVPVTFVTIDIVLAETGI